MEKAAYKGTGEAGPNVAASGGVQDSNVVEFTPLSTDTAPQSGTSTSARPGTPTDGPAQVVHWVTKGTAPTTAII